MLTTIGDGQTQECRRFSGLGSNSELVERFILRVAKSLTDAIPAAATMAAVSDHATTFLAAGAVPLVPSKWFFAFYYP